MTPEMHQFTNEPNSPSHLERRLVAYGACLPFLDGIPPIIAALRQSHDIEPHTDGDTLCGVSRSRSRTVPDCV